MGFPIRYITVVNTEVSQLAVLSGVLLDDCRQQVSTGLLRKLAASCYRQVPMAQIQIARWLFDAECGCCIRGSRSRQESGMSVVESASRHPAQQTRLFWVIGPLLLEASFIFCPHFQTTRCSSSVVNLISFLMSTAIINYYNLLPSHWVRKYIASGGASSVRITSNYPSSHNLSSNLLWYHN